MMKQFPGKRKMSGYSDPLGIKGIFGDIAVVDARKYRGELIVGWFDRGDYDPTVYRSTVRYSAIGRPYIYPKGYGKQYLDEFKWYDNRYARMFAWDGY